ncbi:MAG: DUF998 domain-containing protein [Myxococcales bacterium]|nr:DUF998 domain-containing protein [Myxococcales bacterium]
MTSRVLAAPPTPASGQAAGGTFAVGSPRARIVTSGLAGLLGASLFAASIVSLQVVRPDVDWARDYVSDLANGHFGWVFISATLAHGLGNLATSVGLHLSLERSLLRTWAVFIFRVGAAGIMVGAVVTTDAPGAAPTTAGLVHGAIATGSFVLQLLAVLLFSAEFARQPHWRGRRRWSFVLAMLAAVALVVFFASVRLRYMTGLAERLALGTPLAWELWAAYQLSRWVATPRRPLVTSKQAENVT